MDDWKEIDDWHRREREARAALLTATDGEKIELLAEAERCSSRAWALLNKVERPR